MPDAPLPAPFEAYVGDAAYLFASYAHVDAATVFPELIALRNRGYRIWYDEGIDPGSEWPEEVAKALAGASFFVVFISPNAVTSQNVRNEINYALNNSKPFLAIHIAETKLPPGLQLRMGDIQAIMKYRMADDSYGRKLAKTLPESLRSEEVFKKREPAAADHRNKISLRSVEAKYEYDIDEHGDSYGDLEAIVIADAKDQCAEMKKKVLVVLAKKYGSMNLDIDEHKIAFTDGHFICNYCRQRSGNYNAITYRISCRLKLTAVDDLLLREYIPVVGFKSLSYETDSAFDINSILSRITAMGMNIVGIDKDEITFVLLKNYNITVSSKKHCGTITIESHWFKQEENLLKITPTLVLDLIGGRVAEQGIKQMLEQ